MLCYILLSLALAEFTKGDSIILENDCDRTSEECVIQLETIKGEPGRDCAIFSTSTRLCSINHDEPAVPESDNAGVAKVTETDQGTVVTWHGSQDEAKGSSSSHLSADSVWQSIRKQRRRRSAGGSVVQCFCKPVPSAQGFIGSPGDYEDLVLKKKRSLNEMRSESVMVSGGEKHEIPKLLQKEAEGCTSGYRATSVAVGESDAAVLRKMPAGTVQNCVSFCKMEFINKKTCVGIAFAAEVVHPDDCLLLSGAAGPNETKSDYVLYEKC